jgi:hypothetical protein
MQNAGDVTGDYTNKIKSTEAEVTLRFAPHEKFFQTQWNRFPINFDNPVFKLTHTVAAKGFMGTDYTFNHTEFAFQKRFWFSAFGYTDMILKGVEQSSLPHASLSECQSLVYHTA